MANDDAPRIEHIPIRVDDPSRVGGDVLRCECPASGQGRGAGVFVFEEVDVEVEERGEFLRDGGVVEADAVEVVEEGLQDGGQLYGGLVNSGEGLHVETEVANAEVGVETGVGEGVGVGGEEVDAGPEEGEVRGVGAVDVKDDAG